MTHASLPRLLLVAFRWTDASLRQSLVAQGLPDLTHAQSLVMSSLVGEETRISDIARRLDMTRQGAQKSVAGLEAAGLVYTEVDPNNSSAKLVRLTKAGHDNIACAQKVFQEIEVELGQRIGAEPLAQMRSALEQDWKDPPTIVAKGKERQ